MTTTTMAIARERQLDWLLGEVLGGAFTPAATARPAHAPNANARLWRTAALILLGVGVAIGTAVLRERDDGGAHARSPVAPPAQDAAPPVPWIEIHGDAGIDAAPAEAIALRCFDLTDAGLAGLGRFSQLQQLDLSGMDVDARGVATALKITDEGVRHLAGLPALRWLSLAQCEKVQGETLGELRAVPLLEHLDLTYTGLTSAGIAQLTLLPSLRELTLSHCHDFHGRSLADVARLPGLRRLALAGCETVSAADVQELAALPGLRHLDLRDCMGAFRGQTMVSFDDVTNGPPPERPTHDSIGVTDAAVAALVALPLETLRLDGCRSLTDEVASSLAKLPTLRAVGLGELPGVTARVLAALPVQLVELSLDGNRQLRDGLAPSLAKLTHLEVLSLNGLEQLTDREVQEATRGKPLRELRLGGTRRMGDATGPDGAFRPKLKPGLVARVLAGLPTLEVLEASYSDWFDAEVAAAAAALPRLSELDLQSAALPPGALAALAPSRSLRTLRLVWARGVDAREFERLGEVPLQELDLYGCPDLQLKDPGMFATWPGLRVRLPKGTRPAAPPPPPTVR